MVSKGDKIAWYKGSAGDYKFVHILENAIEGIDLVRNKKAYVDVHSWCFVPHSFRLMMYDLYCLGPIPFQEFAFYPTEGQEFFPLTSG